MRNAVKNRKSCSIKRRSKMPEEKKEMETMADRLKEEPDRKSVV